MEFIETSIQKGRINANTGGGVRAACKKILEQVGADEDVRQVDLRAEVVQYSNRHPGELSAESLRVYESRVRGVIDSFVQFVTDPTGYKLPGKGATQKPRRAEAVKNGEKQAKAPTTSKPAAETDHHVVTQQMAIRAATTETSLALPFPQRPTFLAQIVIPRNLTKDEARRLAAFIDSLAHDPPAAEG
ncbi:MAG: hypothetical protein ACKVQA_25950 [Burkholderiales bacterium]